MLKKLAATAKVTASDYNKMIEAIRGLRILPGFGIQLKQTSAGTSVSIDHGGVVSVGVSSGSGGGGLSISEAFPARIKLKSATLVTTGIYKYKFNRILSGLGTYGVTVSEADMEYAFNLNEFTTPAKSADDLQGACVMMFVTANANEYVFSR